MLSRLLGIRIFDLEACGACNLACPFCPREVLPPTGNMSQETFTKFLDHVPLSGTDTLSFVGIGEPTMNRRLPDFLRQSKSRYPKVRTWITSNGTFLNERILPPLLDAGLEVLDVSFNGLEKQAYERLMKNADFESVLANLEYAATEIERRGAQTQLQINFIVAQETLHEEERIKDFWRVRGIRHFRVQRMHDRNGDVRVDGMTPVDPPGLCCASCAVFDTITFITWDGRVMHCCHDMPRRHPIADIHQHDWGEIQRRKKSIRTRNAWPSMCGQCTDPLRHDMSEKIDQMIRKEIGQKVTRCVRDTVGLLRGLAAARR